MHSDHELIGEVERTAAKFAYVHIEPRAAEIDHTAAGFPKEVFELGIESGFDRLLLPDKLGGSGLEMPELCSLVGTLAKTCAAHALVIGVHAATALSLSEICFATEDTGAQQRLEKLLDTHLPFGVAMPEPLSLRDFSTDLVAHEDGSAALRLSGPSAIAFNWDRSGYLVLFARSDKGERLSLLLSPTNSDASANNGQLEPNLGLRAMPIVEPQLDGQVLHATAVLAKGDRAGEFHQALLCNLSLVTSAVAAGLMQSAHRKALTYAVERYQGGKTIVDHSHLRSILGAMSGAVSASLGSVNHAASRAADPLAALSAKLSATAAAQQVCTDAVQVLGGYGYMRDFGVEKMMRDAAVLTLLPVSNARTELLITALDRELLG